MAKSRKASGLPDDFDLDIPEQTEPEPPVQMGDYLDEIESAPPKAKAPLPREKRGTEANVVAFPRPSKETEESEDPEPKPEANTPALEDTKKPTRRKRAKEYKGP